MTENSMEQLNPRVTDIEIGIRNIRTIRIYPLSIYDQRQLVERLQNAITEFFGSNPESDAAFVAFIIDLIGKNVEEILGIVSDMKKKDLANAMLEIDNVQLAMIARTIYEKNFEEASKNLGGLRDVLAKLFNSSIPQRPLPPLQRSTVSGSNEYFEPAGETEAILGDR